jgi:hypothetical protein
MLAIYSIVLEPSGAQAAGEMGRHTCTAPLDDDGGRAEGSSKKEGWRLHAGGRAAACMRPIPVGVN